MSDSQELFSDDDDLLLELGTRPPKPATQFFSTAQTQLPTYTQPVSELSSIQFQGLQVDLTKAQGEASMLRDKINLLNQEREQEKKLLSENNTTLLISHQTELQRLKREIQYLHDENKFLSLESKRLTSHGRMIQAPRSNSPSTADTTATTSSETSTTIAYTSLPTSPMFKKRKMDESSPITKKLYVPLNSIRITPDEVALFFDSLMSHTISGVDLSTIEILNRIKSDYIEIFQHKTFRVRKGESIGKSLVQLLLKGKKNLSLDKFIDSVLEHLAALIKEITLDKKESNLAVPFLVILMHQVIIFRPSAVHKLALQDLFYFTCDLIKKYQHILKQPLHDSPLELHVEPQIFQYELIDTLVVLYSFDILETTLRILQSHSNKVIHEFFNDEVMNALEQIYKLTLTMSFKPIVNVIFNTIEILNLLSTMSLTLSTDLQLIEPKWWRDCITRLYNILSKEISNQNLYSTDNNSLYLSKFHDCYGLIRNLGSNQIAYFIPKLIDKDLLQSIPKVVSKDDILETPSNFNANCELERWFLELKDEILTLVDNLLIVYPDNGDIINSDLLVHLTKQMAKEQTLMLERYIGQISNNLDFRCHLIEHLLTIIYHIWTNHQSRLSQQPLKDIESELVISLWRVLVSQVEKKDSSETNDSKQLTDQFNDMSFNDQVSYYDDAFEDMPEYIEQELKKEQNGRYPKIMQIKYDDIYQEMARTILESKLDILSSMEDIDSIYLSMGL